MMLKQGQTIAELSDWFLGPKSTEGRTSRVMLQQVIAPFDTVVHRWLCISQHLERCALYLFRLRRLQVAGSMDRFAERPIGSHLSSYQPRRRSSEPQLISVIADFIVLLPERQRLSALDHSHGAPQDRVQHCHGQREGSKDNKRGFAYIAHPTSEVHEVF